MEKENISEKIQALKLKLKYNRPYFTSNGICIEWRMCMRSDRFPSCVKTLTDVADELQLIADQLEVDINAEIEEKVKKILRGRIDNLLRQLPSEDLIKLLND